MKRNRLLRKAVVVTVICLLFTVAFSAAAFADSYTVTKDGTTTYVASGMRALACTKMQDLSEVEWTLNSKDFYYAKTISNGVLTGLVHLKRDDANGNPIKRYGVPYSQVYREFSNIDAKPYVVRLGDTSQTLNGRTYRTVKGVDCSSATCYSWRYAARNGNLTSYTDDFMKGTKKPDESATSTKYIYDGTSILLDALNNSAVSYHRNNSTYTTGINVTKVGNYGSYKTYYWKDGEIQTINDISKIITHLKSEGNYPDGKDVWSEVYAQIKPGDALVCPTHVRLVTGVTIKTNADGSINPNESEIHFIGQIGNNFNEEASNEYATTSWENKSQKFTTLLNAKYLPVKMNKIDS